MTTFISCPKCYEKNEIGRNYCWVCYQPLDPSQKKDELSQPLYPVDSGVPAKDTHEEVEEIAKTYMKPSQTSSFNKFMVGAAKFVAFCILIMTIIIFLLIGLLFITCYGQILPGTTTITGIIVICLVVGIACYAISILKK